jgi:hypothetical protein
MNITFKTKTYKIHLLLKKINKNNKLTINFWKNLKNNTISRTLKFKRNYQNQF